VKIKKGNGKTWPVGIMMKNRCKKEGAANGNSNKMKNSCSIYIIRQKI
jgi:hypothetical protein